MRRPRNPLPYELRAFRDSLQPGLYEITENGITYSMPLEQVRELRSYYKEFTPGRKFSQATIAGWYDSLDKPTKRKVFRTGDIPIVNDFYPDPDPQ